MEALRNKLRAYDVPGEASAMMGAKLGALRRSVQAYCEQYLERKNNPSPHTPSSLISVAILDSVSLLFFIFFKFLVYGYVYSKSFSSKYTIAMSYCTI